MNDKDRLSASLGEYQDLVNSALDEMEADQIIGRIWSQDHTVWKPEPDEISNRLGWLNIPEKMLAEIPRLESLADELYSAGYTHARLLGMGGSSLAPEVFRETFGVGPRRLDLSVLDSTDPSAVRAATAELDLSKTLFIVATKSGGTTETLSFFKFFYNQVAQQVGEESAGDHFLAITDPGSNLEVIAKSHQFRETFLNDPNIGGRYSALSYFGLVSAALLGVDLKSLLKRALTARSACENSSGLLEGKNPAAQLGAILGELAKGGQGVPVKDKLTLIISPGISSFGNWVEQLIAESTGKEGTGILPVVGEPPGNPAIYGKDRFFVYLRLADDDTHDSPVQELTRAGYPVIRLNLEDKYDLGAQFFIWEMATALAGYRLGINPFNQPNVESAKILAREMVARYMEKGALPAGEFAHLSAKELNSFLDNSFSPGRYIALQAYLYPTPDVESALQSLRMKLRDYYQAAITLGYGPRFLHSTGQLHKGDSGNGIFVQLVSGTESDLPIPDEAGRQESAMSFGVLKEAQALGDARALIDAGRQVIRFDLGTAVLENIKILSK